MGEKTHKFGVRVRVKSRSTTVQKCACVEARDGSLLAPVECSKTSGQQELGLLHCPLVSGLLVSDLVVAARLCRIDRAFGSRVRDKARKFRDDTR